LRWGSEALHKHTREIARLGMFECAIIKGGADSIGLSVYTGTFNGVVVSVAAATFADCERDILHAAKRELLRAGVELGKALS
jgi:hypothetical protein